MGAVAHLFKIKIEQRDDNLLEIAKQLNNSIYVKAAQQQIQFIHNENKGLINLFQKNGQKTCQRTWGYNYEDLLDNIDNWIEQDVYLSLNTFKGARRKNNLLKFNALYSDLDSYKFEIDAIQARQRIDELIANEEILTPNCIIYSGQGLQVVYLVREMYATEGYKKLWYTMQNSLYDRLKSLNSDYNAKSETQIFRLAGSVNSKNNAIVKVEYLKEERYTVAELKDFLLDEIPEDWKERAEKKKQQRIQRAIQRTEQGITAQCKLTSTTLHKARIDDLYNLLHIRVGDVPRRRFIYVYTVTAYRLKQTPDTILKALQRINKTFYKPLPDALLKYTVKYYEKLDYKFRNTTIISLLEITQDEQRIMKTIIDKLEKNRRKKVANEKLRRSKGIVTMKEYNTKRLARKEELKIHIEKLHSQGIKQKEIAEYLSLTKGRVSQLLKEIHIHKKV